MSMNSASLSAKMAPLTDNLHAYRSIYLCYLWQVLSGLQQAEHFKTLSACVVTAVDVDAHHSGNVHTVCPFAVNECRRYQ